MSSVVHGALIRVALPAHLRALAQVGPEIRVHVVEPVTRGAVLDSLEANYPMLRGTMRDHVTKKRRDFVRFFACQEDLSLESADAVLPQAVIDGREPLLVVGAMAGG